MNRNLWLAAKVVVCLGAVGGYVYSNTMTIEPQGDRVQAARERAGAAAKQLCLDAGLKYPLQRIFFRAIKDERVLEVWGADSGRSKFKLIHTYPIAAMSGKLGPKRKEGDLQVPEGFYHIDRFNPKSRFLLSLGLNYPNASDRILSDKKKPGGDIFIHGNAVSIGCLAMTDPKIEEIYLLALSARDSGQTKIPVHVFPFRMTTEKLAANRTSKHFGFWQALKPGYDAFQSARQVPSIRVDSKGKYSLNRPKPSNQPNNP